MWFLPAPTGKKNAARVRKQGKIKTQLPEFQIIALCCCGGGEIRTPGTFQYDGFQDRSIKPLWHSSGAVLSAYISACSLKCAAKVNKSSVPKIANADFILRTYNAQPLSIPGPFIICGTSALLLMLSKNVSKKCSMSDTASLERFLWRQMS